MKKLISRSFAIFVVAIVWLVCWLLVRNLFSPATVASHAEAISNAVSNLTVALISIMAGAVAFATALKDNFWMRRFRSSGQMREFLWFYGVTIASLFVTHLLSVYALVNANTFGILMACFITNIIQALYIMWQAHSIAAHGENSSQDSAK